MKKIAIIGTGGFAGEVYAMLKQNNASLPNGMFEYYFVDTNCAGEKYFNQPIIEDCAIFTDMELIFAVGNTELRMKIAKGYTGFKRSNPHISIFSIIGENCEMEKNTLIMQHCVITNNVSIGSYTHVNIGTTIGHGTQIGSFVTISPGCNISGNVTIGNSVYIGTNTCIKQGVAICDNVIIGMGSVVVKDITEPGTYFGNPCKKQK